MFAGVDKLGGDVVGGVISEKSSVLITMGESAATASAEETLVGKAVSEDGTSKEVSLRSRVDPTSGGLCWLPVDAAVAAEDTTSMSQMSSMLNDVSRNKKYEKAITSAVQEFTRENGRPPVVLDIGTGTGLLSMLSVRAGATEVYGCELYQPLADIARDVTSLNCGDKIKARRHLCIVIAKKSTDLSVGEGMDLARRADMCINEIYDSALLGEGCLPALRHALANLLVDKPVIVPAGAGVYGALLSSSSLRSRHDLSRAEFSKGVPVPRNPRAADCKGGRRALPLQGVEVEDAVLLSDRFHALDFDFRSPFPEEGCRGRKVSVRVQHEGVLDAVMMTWDLSLHGDVEYSTRPGAENWQDHWCPSYFPVCNRVYVHAGDLVHLKVTHSELNIMFEVSSVDTKPEQQDKREEEAATGVAGDGTGSAKANLKRDRSPGHSEPPPPRTLVTSNGTAKVGGTTTASKRAYDADGYRMEREWDPEPCGCGWHVLCNPERIGMLRDESRRETYRLAVARLLEGLPVATESSTVLDIGDGAACAFLAAGEGAGAVVSYEPAEWSHLLVGQVIRNNDLEKMHLLEGADEWPFLRELVGKGGDDAEAGGEGAQQEHLLCDALVGEPFYYRMQSLVLYEAVNFWYLRRVFNPALKPDARILPMRAIVCVAGVELPELSLSHGPVGSVLGFDHAPYDDRIRSRWHELLYPYPLRAYKHRLLTETQDLLSLDYASLPSDVRSTVTISPSLSGTVHAVAIWVDYQLDETSRWSTFGGVVRGGQGDGESGRRGGVHEKQMLRFLSKPLEVERGDAAAALTVSGRFDVEGGCMSFEVVEP
ncbi:unnamed protein product [Scytosiphon promiscuus]